MHPLFVSEATWNEAYQGRGCSGADLEHSAPLGESRALLVVLGAALAQIVQTLHHYKSVAREGEVQ